MTKLTGKCIICSTLVLVVFLPGGTGAAPSVSDRTNLLTGEETEDKRGSRLLLSQREPHTPEVKLKVRLDNPRSVLEPGFVVWVHTTPVRGPLRMRADVVSWVQNTRSVAPLPRVETSAGGPERPPARSVAPLASRFETSAGGLL